MAYRKLESEITFGGGCADMSREGGGEGGEGGGGGGEGDELFGQSRTHMQEFIGPSSIVKHENLS
jgi:hypothetical protein